MLYCWVGKVSGAVCPMTTVAHPRALESSQHCCQNIRLMFYMCVEYCRLHLMFIFIVVLLAGISDCQLDSRIH